MTQKTDFNAGEWSELLEGPPIAGMIVIAAQRGGTLRETLSMGKAYKEARESYEGPALIGEFLASNPEVNPAGYKSAADLHDRGLQQLRQAVAILEAKAEPGEVDAYREFVLTIAERVAHRHKSGGFLGIGGEEVSDNERAAIEEVREALGGQPG